MRKNKLIGLLCGLALIGLNINNCLAKPAVSWLRATQWIKITANDNLLAYETKIYSLQNSTIDCGKGCQIIKLSNTPFTLDGEVRMNVNLSNCMLSDLHQAVLPFKFSANGYLYTPSKVYQLTVDKSCYSSTQKIDVIINVAVIGNPLSGYEVEISAKNK